MTNSYTLTNDQKKGADAFFEFLMNEDKYFCLSGGAGVGKTFLMGHISDQVMQTYEDACKLLDIPQQYNDVIFTATTNKAAEVLEKSLGKPVQTIHSFLALKVRENRKTGKTELESTSNTVAVYNKIVFIDESSMINTVLTGWIEKCFKDCKVIFVGDHAQMAPVGEDISPIYNLVSEENFVFLAEPVRNADSPPLMALCEQLRNTVETGEFHPMAEVPGHIEYLNGPQMQAKLEETFAEPDGSARILCYTNARVQNFNAFIREVEGKEDSICEGDVMVVASAYAQGNMSLSVEREVVITKVKPEIHSAGYGYLCDDGEDIKFRNIEITTSLSGDTGISVAVVTEPERLRHVLQKLARKKQFSEYFDLKASFLDLRDKHACTVYKSQGSTYETVFIDIGNIGVSHDPKQVARMLFVGVSRARSKIYFFGKLPTKYIGRRVA